MLFFNVGCVLSRSETEAAEGAAGACDPGGGPRGGDQRSAVPLWDRHPLPHVGGSPRSQTPAQSPAQHPQTTEWGPPSYNELMRKYSSFLCVCCRTNLNQFKPFQLFPGGPAVALRDLWMLRGRRRCRKEMRRSVPEHLRAQFFLPTQDSTRSPQKRRQSQVRGKHPALSVHQQI